MRFFAGDNAAGDTGGSPASNVMVKNEWNYTDTPSHVFMTRCSVKHAVNTFIFSCHWKHTLNRPEL